ncbi:retron Ec67 family RNA-directed DNA polymerase/endonuclease [Duganella sp. Leaf126]|uniref:retron Ec67 family RNA-directed DNA polymerase/endonuclease n=1 Tax=Duganella sp. Leaf126 TaxID=1736266 RepID=UPI00138F26BA|nr:retron Ec67 family RNA-directed DNA polymerase/endonuclease [Duganella sp. Leaf126]
MSSLQALKAASARRDLADLLGVKPGMLTYAIYITPEADRYTRSTIPKKHGGDREICAPNNDLKLIQRRLSTLLQDCLDEINVARGHKEDRVRFGIAHGFKRNHTIMTNGRAHITRRFVFNADLHDFFGTINFGRVRGFFLKDKNFSLQPEVATTIAQIACFENKLPQGSPCSPIISNFLAHPLDIRLVRLAAKHGVTYTRYADDLTFSTNKPAFPVEIASPIDSHGWIPGPELECVVTESGFSFNPSKTRLQYRDSRQEVTGLTVNRKVNVPATYRYTVRAMVNTLFKTGSFEFIYRKRGDDGKVTSENREPGTMPQLLGMLSYIDQVDLFNEKLCKDNDREPQPVVGRTALFRRFLYFDTFFSAQRPTIVCEGKTDNVYMRCAIKSLAAAYPRLIGGEKLLVRFFKYTESRTGRVMDLTGGVGGICNLLKSYHEDLKFYFKAPISKFPVIVLIDNDSGAHSIYEAVAGITKKKKPQGVADFIYVTGNVYIVPTPFGPGKSFTAIEDFFDAKTLATELNSKKFNRKNKKEDSEDFYSKAAFARDVVAKGASTIDFGNFKVILDRIEKVLDDYAVRRKTMT